MFFIRYLIAVFLLLSLQACSDSKDQIQNYVKSGKNLYQQGNYPKAAVEFKNAIQSDNKQAEAFYYLALIDEQNKNWQGMFANLSRVIELEPNNVDARLKQGQLYLLTNAPDKTLEEVKSILKISPDNFEALLLKAAVLSKTNNTQEAMTLADEVLKKKPDHVEAISLKAFILLGQKNYPEALAVVDKALQQQPNDMSLNLTRLTIHVQTKNVAAVEQDYLDLIKRFPDKLEFVYALAKEYSNNGQDDKALPLLQDTVKTHHDQLMPKLVLVDYLMLKKHPEQVEPLLKTYIEQYPDDAGLHLRLAAIYLSNNKYAEAKQSFNWLLEHKRDDKDIVLAKNALADIAAREGDYKTATTLSNEVLAINNRDLNALLLKTKMDLMNGLYDESIAVLRTILQDHSDSEEALVLLAQAYTKKGSPELAEENYRKALTLDPADFSAVMPVVSKMVQSKDITRAEETLEKALAIKPDNAGALQALAQVRLLKKDWVGSQKVADVIATKQNGKGYSQYLSAVIFEGQGRYEEAVVKYKEALQTAPGLSDAIRGIVNCYKQLHQDNNAVTYLDDYIKAHPENNYPVVLKSQLLMAEKRDKDAITLLSAAIDKWPKVPGLYEQLAAIYFANKETDKVIAVYKKAIQQLPDNTQLNMILASFYEQFGDYQSASKIYEALLIKQPKLDIAVNNLVSILLDHYSSKENIERAVKLSAPFEHSEQPFYMDTYGWALANSGRYDEALPVLKEVVTKMPNIAVFNYHLGFVYFKKNDKTAAVAALKQALKLGEKEKVFAEKNAAEKLLKEIGS